MHPDTRFAAWTVGLACCVFAIGIRDESSRADELRIVASIKPVHALVAGVTEGIAEPTLLIKGAASPHSYALTPSDASALESADVVFWIGESFEMFLARPLETLAGGATVVALDRSDGLIMYDRREGGLWERDDHEHDGKIRDGHLWLDPRNATVMVDRIAGALAELDPTNAAAYQTNAGRLTASLAELDNEIARTLESVEAMPFVVFHDAFQYFERRYGLAGVGSITANPDQPPGAKRLQELRDAIIDRQVECIFREPNFEPRLIDALAAGTSARIGVLDPEGASLPAGATLYFDLMHGIAASFKACLSANS